MGTERTGIGDECVVRLYDRNGRLKQTSKPGILRRVLLRIKR